MKTTEINIRKIVADEGKILVSKKTIEISDELAFPEAYGTEIYLGISANSTDFEEVELEYFEELQSKVQNYKLSQKDLETSKETISESEEDPLKEDSTEAISEESNDSN